MPSLPEVKFENVDQYGCLILFRDVGPCTVVLPESLQLLWGEFGSQLRIESFERRNCFPHYQEILFLCGDNAEFGSTLHPRKNQIVGSLFGLQLIID